MEQIKVNKSDSNQISTVMKKDHFLFTSESVCAGHPDKLCDYISDSVLDACLAQDPESHVACESAVKNNLCMVFGEVSTNANLAYEQVVRQAIKEVGYTDVSIGMDYTKATVISAIDIQSHEINTAVVGKHREEEIGAGDQGLMIGYASDECPEMMPLTLIFANKLCMRLNECREKKIIPWLGPDGKSQVTIEYQNDKGNLKPIRVHTVLISAQHQKGITQKEIHDTLVEKVVKEVIPKKYIDDKIKYFMNPSGAFVLGGPGADAGLTGRKIIVDTYGGWGGHGGGAFSGKDPSKVDRSAAYAARWVAKSLVSNHFCHRAMVQLSYGIGVSYPISLYVDTYGTCAEGYTDFDLQQIANRNFDLRPGCIVRDLKLKRPIYRKTAAYGHFGRNDPDFTWETPMDLTHEKKKSVAK